MKTASRLRLLPFAWATLFAAPCLAAGPATRDPIATDRPDFVESSATVGDGRVQVETSAAWERSDGAGVRSETFSTPTLLRIGVSDRWELRVESDGWLHSRAHGTGLSERVRGAADVSVGAKYHLRDRDGAPSMAWLLHADLPTGDRTFAGHGVRPSLRFVAEWELTRDLSLGVMPGVIRDDDGSGHYTAGIFGIVLGKAWTPRFRSFGEVAAEQLARPRDGGNAVNLDLGGAWLLSDDMQLDVAMSARLSDAAPDRAVTLGWSRRW